MRNKILPLLLIVSSFSFGQNKFFYVEIPSEKNVPKVNKASDNKINLVHTDQEVNRLFSNYSIYKFEKAFPTSKTEKLKNVYVLECNSFDLKDQLSQRFRSYFLNTEYASQPELLYTPNDYHYSGDYLNSKNYDLINVKKAWDYSHGDPKFFVGVSDTPAKLDHPDLSGKVFSLYSNPVTPDGHGTASAGIIGANTDNNLGIAGIGFNSSVLSYGTSVGSMLELSQNGARVINASWGYELSQPSTYEQMIIDEIHDNGSVIIVSAGNGPLSGSHNPFTYYYPASYNHVISVGGVGSQDVGWIATYGSSAGLASNWRDRVEIRPGDSSTTYQTNDKVDIMAPGFGSFSTVIANPSLGIQDYSNFGGTSAAAPHVSGAASLMLTANGCLNPDEVESILKLSSASIDNISTNIPYIGKIGSGRLDAGRATEISWQMNPSNGGEVNVKDRHFDRWHFELLNSPQKIRIENQSFTDNADILFRAKEYILIDTNVLLKPGPDKSDYLYISNENTCYNFKPTFNPSNIITNKKADFKQETYSDLQNNDISIYPIPAKENIFIKSNIDFNTAEIKIYDGNGRLVQQNVNNNKNNIISINLSKLVSGNYILDILFDGKKHYSKKIVKQ